MLALVLLFVSVVNSYIAKSDILNQSWVEVGAGNDLLEKGVDNVVEGSILETTLLGLSQWGTGSKSDDNIISVLGGAVSQPVSFVFNV